MDPTMTCAKRTVFTTFRLALVVLVVLLDEGPFMRSVSIVETFKNVSALDLGKRKGGSAMDDSIKNNTRR